MRITEIFGPSRDAARTFDSPHLCFHFITAIYHLDLVLSSLQHGRMGAASYDNTGCFINFDWLIVNNHFQSITNVALIVLNRRD